MVILSRILTASWRCFCPVGGSRGCFAPTIRVSVPRKSLPGLILAQTLVVVLSGCSAPRMEHPEVNAAELGDEGFQHYLAQVDVVTVDEAFRAMLILADGEDGRATFEERKAELESRGIARPQWNLHGDHVIDAGSVAYMVCQVCKIRGGVNMALMGSWGFGDRRYALRELIYRQMLSEMVEYQYMTGSELHNLMRKADNLMMQKGLYESEKIDLTDEGDRDEHGNLIVPPPTK